jgi:hypothetical protein
MEPPPEQDIEELRALVEEIFDRRGLSPAERETVWHCITAAGRFPTQSPRVPQGSGGPTRIDTDPSHASPSG